MEKGWDKNVIHFLKLFTLQKKRKDGLGAHNLVKVAKLNSHWERPSGGLTWDSPSSVNVKEPILKVALYAVIVSNIKVIQWPTMENVLLCS